MEFSHEVFFFLKTNQKLIPGLKQNNLSRKLLIQKPTGSLKELKGCDVMMLTNRYIQKSHIQT
jgi:hypothetical protein